MADITQIKVGSTTYDIKDSRVDGLISSYPNDGGEIKTKCRISAKEHTGSDSTTWYYELCTLPANNSNNYASALVSGRIGG